MAKIHKLSPVLANQIAAGEVVERPASVVKELVENSLDAKSRQIDVWVKGSGREAITVTDDGSGISKDDVQLAFQRHATSKIHNRRDLFQVDSLGFRGEALPSIASVSDVNLKTSTGGVGTQIHIKGGQTLDVKPAEARRGTSVTVRDLFFNTPARLKYMKSPATELSRITDIVDRLALGHPQVAFSLVHNHHEILRTPGRGDLRQVIGSIYGINKVKKMLPFRGHDLDFKISGYFSLPELTRASRNYISVILNGRYVKNLKIAKAVIKGYGSKLMVGRYPIVVLRITTDPILVDPNVHPSKQTVRISKELSLCRLIAKTIFAKMAKQDLIPDELRREHAVKPEPNIKPSQISMNLGSASGYYAAKPNPTRSVSVDYHSKLSRHKLVTPVVVRTKSDLLTLPVRNFEERYPNGNLGPIFRAFPKTKPNVDSVRSNSPKSRFPRLHYIGQLHGTYLLAEADDGMYILDQHAAQERINYEYFRKQIGDVSADEQDLLVPIVLEYSNTETLQIMNHLAVLKSVGLNLEPFGKDSFVVHQHPTWFQPGQEKATIEEMIEWVLANGRISVAQFRAKTAIMMSCKRAIKANYHLNRDQAVTLIQRLSQTEDPFNCPHGRPVLVHFSNRDMQRMFKRIQDPHRSNPWRQK